MRFVNFFSSNNISVGLNEDTIYECDDTKLKLKTSFLKAETELESLSLFETSKEKYFYN